MNHRLNALEQVIDKRRRSFYQIGKALREIRDERLYRELLYDTFEQYLKKRWDMCIVGDAPYICSFQNKAELI
jgi:hypothetical protein